MRRVIQWFKCFFGRHEFGEWHLHYSGKAYNIYDPDAFNLTVRSRCCKHCPFCEVRETTS